MTVEPEGHLELALDRILRNDDIEEDYNDAWTGDGSDPVLCSIERQSSGNYESGMDINDQKLNQTDPVACPEPKCYEGEILNETYLDRNPDDTHSAVTLCSECGGTGVRSLDTLPSRPKTLLVAERFNQDYNSTAVRRHYLMTEEGAERWYRISLRIGNFRKGPSRISFRSLGLSWNASLNLTLPARQGVPFDFDQAHWTACEVLKHTGCELLLLCGIKVTESFTGLTGSLLPPMFELIPIAAESNARWIARVPHPSGANRWWHGIGRLDEARTKLVPAMYEKSKGLQR